MMKKFDYISLVGIVFVNGLEDRDSIPSRVKPKTQKMILDAALLNTKYHILSFLVCFDLGLNPSPPDHWQTLTFYIYIYGSGTKLL